MRVLIFTQKIDRRDDGLGFFHRWLEVFSTRFESIIAVGLGIGDVDLPKNVKVYSLGKEQKQSRLQYLFRFYTYIWRERKNYDVVLVHMNKEYVVLGGLFWRLMGKKVVLWYNHRVGTFQARLAGMLAHTILYTSSYSFFSHWPKAIQMPVGIDTDMFKPDYSAKVHALLCLGRIAPVKNVDVLIEAAHILYNEGIKIPTHIYGGALAKDAEYEAKIRERALPLVEAGIITFHGQVSNIDTPAIYRKYEIYANLTPSGSFDKTIIEAMASGSLVIASNKSFEDLLPPRYHRLMVFEDRNAAEFAKKVKP
jgi:glycosyltransferase involved in cell wall biosynthesis